MKSPDRPPCHPAVVNKLVVESPVVATSPLGRHNIQKRVHEASTSDLPLLAVRTQLAAAHGFFGGAIAEMANHPCKKKATVPAGAKACGMWVEAKVRDMLVGVKVRDMQAEAKVRDTSVEERMLRRNWETVRGMSIDKDSVLAQCLWVAKLPGCTCCDGTRAAPGPAQR